LFLAQPWLLPACHCHYRTNVGCSFLDCFTLLSDEFVGFVDSVDMYTDFLVAAEHNWRIPFDETKAFGTIRACQAFPGPPFPGDFDNLLLPLGGSSYEECFGFCNMYRSFVNATTNACDALYSR
jgi:hypothetical protein